MPARILIYRPLPPRTEAEQFIAEAIHERFGSGELAQFRPRQQPQDPSEPPSCQEGQLHLERLWPLAGPPVRRKARGSPLDLPRDGVTLSIEEYEQYIKIVGEIDRAQEALKSIGYHDVYDLVMEVKSLWELEAGAHQEVGEVRC